MEPSRTNRRRDEGNESTPGSRQVNNVCRDNSSELLVRRGDPARTSRSAKRERVGIERLTQYLPLFFSRRGLGRLGAGLLVTRGGAAPAKAKKH
jgi:hypothetical protein